MAREPIRFTSISVHRPEVWPGCCCCCWTSGRCQARSLGPRPRRGPCSRPRQSRRPPKIGKAFSVSGKTKIEILIMKLTYMFIVLKKKTMKSKVKWNHLNVITDCVNIWFMWSVWQSPESLIIKHNRCIEDLFLICIQLM